MPRLALIFGLVLILLGVGLYAGTGFDSPTAMIPSGFGLLLAICGLVGQSEKLRMHAMHVAALVALLGTLGGLVMGFMRLNEAAATALAGMFAMGVVSLVFLVLSIRSFVQARRARETQGPGSEQGA